MFQTAELIAAVKYFDQREAEAQQQTQDQCEKVRDRLTFLELQAQVRSIISIISIIIGHISAFVLLHGSLSVCPMRRSAVYKEGVCIQGNRQQDLILLSNQFIMYLLCILCICLSVELFYLQSV